jgi:bifunctional oligoribonuclease and PAP phosphatase NrnA
MLSKKELGDFLLNPQKIIITTHHKPDGDALGSSLALTLVLNSMGHQVKVISPSDYPPSLNWLPEASDILVFPNHTEASSRFIAEASLIFCLDFNHLSRIYDLGILIEHSTAPKVMMDHHLEPQGFEDLAFWDPEASSTCQIVYRFLQEFKEMDRLNASVATCLYTGIMTDSGSFRFPRTSPELHRITASLIEAGANNVDIQERIGGSQSLSRLQFLGFCISQKLVVLPEYNTAYFFITSQELEKFQIETGETDGIVNYALSIDSIKLAAFFVERLDKIKISFRSKGSFPSNVLASKYFSGGGHLNAAGGETLLSLEETIKKFKSVLPEFRQLLLT